MKLEAITPETAPLGPTWVTRVVEVLQPVSVRADRLGSIDLFAGLTWPELEFAAGLLSETLVQRGTRMTVQGRPSPKIWLLLEGEALVSADARPLRVAARGDVLGAASMLYRSKSPETTIALTPIGAFEAGPAQFGELIRRDSIRLRLTAAAGDHLQASGRRPRIVRTPGRQPTRLSSPGA